MVCGHREKEHRLVLRHYVSHPQQQRQPLTSTLAALLMLLMMLLRGPVQQQ